MKTIKDIKKEITQLETLGKTASEQVKNRYRKRLKMIRPLVTYLERVTPSPESVNDQLLMAIKRKERIEQEFEYAYPAGCDSRTKSTFMKGKGLPEIKKQIKTLQYLLESK